MNAPTATLVFRQLLAGEERELVSFATHPSRYRHWKLSVEGDVARLKLDIDEEGGIKPGYKLKLNSLSAWQNWIFIRPNAVGEEGALKLFGSGKKARFDWKRV